MNESYSDDETNEFQEEEQPDQRWGERIRRSCASTDIVALMDTEMDEDSGREEVEEHTEALPQKWIEYYRDKFNANFMHNRWTPPPVLEERFRVLLNTAMIMCEAGHADGAVDMFIQDNLNPLFRKWYYSGEAVDHWPVEIFLDIGESIFKVMKMLRGLIVAGAGSRDISPNLWDLFFHVTTEFRTNMIVADRLHQMNIEGVDESQEAYLVKPEYINAGTSFQKYARFIVLLYGTDGFVMTGRFFEDNITESTSIEELVRYLKCFKVLSLAMNSDRAYETFGPLVYTAMDRLTAAKEEEMSCKNLRGPLDSHLLFQLYIFLVGYVHSIDQLQHENVNMLALLRWRLRFALKALNEAPFNGRMSAVESLTMLVNDFGNLLGTRGNYHILMKWLEEFRAVDMLTRDNLHNASYVDRVLRTFDHMLRANIFTTGDLSIVWEAQRGKHDVIQRNLAELIVRIVPNFDNDLLEVLFHKIQAGWVDGGVKERATLIDIVRKIGEQSAQNINNRRPSELDQALILSSLKALWHFIRNPGASKENEEAALQAHIKLLDDSRGFASFVKVYAELCSADILKQNEISATAASHLVHILELAGEEEEEDDDAYDRSPNRGGRYRQELIASLEESFLLVQSLCANIARTVRRTDDTEDRRGSLCAFLVALNFFLSQSKDLRLSEELASELWEALISRPALVHDMKIGFKFFMGVVDNEVMDKSMLVRFYKTYVLEVSASDISSDGYLCFDSFFKAVNDIYGHDSLKSPDELLGADYVRDLILCGQPEVHHRATNLWVDNLQKVIYKLSDPVGTAALVKSLVNLIMDQYRNLEVSIREAAARGLSLTHNPAYEMTKERTMRCIKVLSLTVNTLDDEVMVARRSVPALGKAAIGRPVYVNCKVPRREWDSVPYKFRTDTRADDLDLSCDMHENTTIAELRDLLKKQLCERLMRIPRRKTEVDEVLEHFLLVHASNDGPKTLHFSDYKRTLGELGVGEVVEIEIRLNKNSRQGEISPDTSTSDSDWMSPEEMADDFARESILPSKALAADEGMIDQLLQVAESSDVDIAMSAFQLLTSVPQNAAKLAHLQAALRDEARLLQLLLDSSDSRFLYYLMMLEAMILPTDHNLRVDPDAMNAMMMFIRVLPEVGMLSKLMKRSVAFRSLAIVSITRLLHLACLTVARVVMMTRWGLHSVMNSTVGNLVRLSHVDLPVKWSKYMRVRRLSSFYSEGLSHTQARELVMLAEAHSRLLLNMLCGVVLAAASFHSANPIAEDSARILTMVIEAPLPMLDEATMESDPCTIPALLECAVYATALLAAACPQQCAQFIGAVGVQPDKVWMHTILSATFHKAENVRSMTWCQAVAMIDVVRSSLMASELMDFERGHVSLTDMVLDMLPHCEGTEKYADQFVSLVKECVNRTSSWNAKIVRLDEHILHGVKFLDEALLHSTSEHSPFPDETYLKARIEVLTKLMRYTTATQRENLGSAEGGPRLCERLLADFIFPSGRAAETAAAASAASTGDSAVVIEMDPLPRSMTHVEMNSSSSLFELTGKGEGCLPRSVSALPISTRRVAVCSGEGSQDGVFQLLLALCETVPTNQVLMQTTIHRLFYSNPWTDKKDFDYLPQHVLRGEGDLVGLKNGGATCYMNSIFQQLFMIDEVREAVLNAAIPEKVLLERRTSGSSLPGETGGAATTAAPNRGEYAVKVLAAVQTLFAHLLGSELDSYRPAEFWKVFAFKPNGESVNVREQQDAVEFHNMVTELIDEGLKKCGAEAMCEKTFRGVYADEKICKDCPHRYTKEEPFESLSLDVRSHNNLRDSLKEYVKGDVLENDNAYHCELCNKKVKAIKRLSLSKLPEVLIVQLKRFDFDWEKEISVKFNDYFEFPFELDIQPYTVEGLEKLEKGLALENNRDYQYMLRGVVVHSGQAQGGHYTSYIRNRETGKWFKFDDSDVTPWDASEGGAQQRWFGCTDNGQDSMGRGRRKIRTTYWNAYMLFYEKLETANRYLSVNPSSVASDMSTSSGVSSMTTTMTAILSSAVSSAGPTCVSPTPTCTPATVTVSASTTAATGSAVSPTLMDLKGTERTKQQQTRPGKSVSPVSHLHRHFSSMSLSSARIHMPPRLEEMLREGNRCVQLERVQYSTHFFAFVASSTAKAIKTAEAHPECADVLMLATMKSFASFIVHNGLFASRDLIGEDEMNKCSSTSWQDYMARLLTNQSARLWFITHVLFSHEQAACFLFASDVAVRGFFQHLIMDTMTEVEKGGDASEACLRPAVVSPVAAQLAQSIRLFPRLSHLLGHLLGMLPYKYNAAFRSEPITFYRTIIMLADKPNMMAAIVRGGILNNLLTLFQSTHTHTDLSSLQRRDAHVYENLHRVIANGLRTIRLDTKETVPNPWSDANLVVRRSELPHLEILSDFMQKDGGNVKFIQNLVDMLRRSNRASDVKWAVSGILYLCHGNPFTSYLVMDTICQFVGTMVSETAMEWLLSLLRDLFSIRDNWIESRCEHIFYKVQLTSTHAQPSVQGLLELDNVAESRTESLIRVLTAALTCTPAGVISMIENDVQVTNLLRRVCTSAMVKVTNAHYQEFYQWYQNAFAAASSASRSSDEYTADTITDSTGDSTMEDESKAETGGGERPAAHLNNMSYIISASSPCSPGQLSPSSRLGAMTLTTGEKRPLPPTEEGEEADWPGSVDRKRSFGETMIKSCQWPSPPTAIPTKIEDYTASPMDDSDLLISSSTPSTSSAVPSVPPPAYTELMGAGLGGAVKSVLSPPPVPPRPNAAAAAAARLAEAASKSSFDSDEFVVEKHKTD